jgi:hypothetical protein
MKLPVLPVPDGTLYGHDRTIRGHAFITEKVRQIQRDAISAAFKEAEMICDKWSKDNHVYVNGALRCGQEIQKLRIEMQ